MLVNNAMTCCDVINRVIVTSAVLIIVHLTLRVCGLCFRMKMLSGLTKIGPFYYLNLRGMKLQEDGCILLVVYY
jgi:hypothetical protein